ncbi:MAG: monovalent cation/H(+) antiporter subunit G [Blautia sp.]|nr:monovalent cation/H(+) antiporter subunit G [Blautia sp.]
MIVLGWIRFALTAVILVGGLACFTAAVLGVWRFDFILNRIHSAGIGDTLALFLVMLSLAFSSGFHMDTLKLVLLCLFMWFSSPVSTHFLSQIEYFTNPDLYDHVDRAESADLE